jgi:hypothetical protein
MSTVYSSASGVLNIEGSHVTLQNQVKKAPPGDKRPPGQGKSPVIPEESRATEYVVGGKNEHYLSLFPDVKNWRKMRKEV